MAKALKIVGTVVAVVAIAATAVATFGASIGLGMAALSAAAGVATIAGVAAAVIGVASAVLFKPGFTNQGNPQDFQTNPQSGLPYAIGRTRMSGLRIYADTSRTPGYNDANDLLWFGVMLSAGGQIGGIEKFTADNELIAFNAAGASPGKYFTWMEQVVWTGGLMTSALAISMNGGFPPYWTSAHKLSGITHALWGLRYDAKKGEYYSAGVPQPSWIGKWVRVYDPRLDSTYPGGSGACRPLNEATYVWSRNPALHALTWCLGRWQNGKRTVGIGAPFANIRVGDFVEAANVADANNWGCGGVEYSTDSKWDVLKRMLQAGGAIPTMTGAMIGCRVNKPRLSVATITSADLLEEFSGAVTKPRRDRYNTVIPRYRSESHEWEVISAKPVTVPAFVTQDGGIRQKEIDYPLVQAEVGQGSFNGDVQAGQLAAYDIVNSREAGPIKWTTGPKFIGLKTGDCVTLNVPDEGYSGQPVIITGVSLDPSSGKISFTAETETSSKHAFALGTSAVPPPPFALTPPALTPPIPNAGDWTLSAEMTNDGLPLIRLRGGSDTPAWDRVIVQYMRSPTGDWTNAGVFAEHGDTLVDISGIDGNAPYAVRIAYQKGAITGEWLEFPGTITPSADVRLNPRGNYAAGTTYNPGDVVVWASGTGATGDSYKRIGTGATTGVAPSDGSKWVVLAIRGAPGASGYTWVAYADSADGTVNFTLGAPQGRGFQGLAVNKTAATESTVPADYQWGEYRGPANFGLVPHANVIVGPDYIVKSGGVSTGWDASAYSSEAYIGGAFVSFTATVGPGLEVIIGLNTDPATNVSWDSLDYGIMRRSSGDINIYESGALVGTFGTYADGDAFNIVYDNKSVNYTRNGTLLRSVSAPAGLRLYLDSSLNHLGARVGGLKFGPVGAAGADAVAYVQDATPGAPPSSNQLWIKPSTKQIFRWNGTTWVDTHGSLARYDEIVAGMHKADEGVDIGALVPGTQRALGTVTAGPGTIATVGAGGGTVNTSDYAVITVPITTDHIIRIKMSGTGFASGNTVPGNTAPQLGMRLRVKIGAGAYTNVPGAADSKALPTTALATLAYENTAFGLEIKSTWTGTATFALQGYVIGGVDAGATMTRMDATIEILGAK